jgi:hypothetical protein
MLMWYSALMWQFESQMRLEHLEEAGNELMLAEDDDSARYLVGESWLHINNDTAEERLQAGAPFSVTWAYMPRAHTSRYMSSSFRAACRDFFTQLKC